MSTIAVIEETPRSVSVLDVRNSPRFLSRTGLFFKKVSSFRTVRRKSEDTKTSGVYPRSSRSMELNNIGNKAFGMSQPILGVNTEHSLTDNEEQSDSSPTDSGSPTYTAPPEAETVEPHISTPSPPRPKPESANADASSVDTTPRVPPTDGLPLVSESSSARPVDGLPASPVDQSWVMLEGTKKPAAAAPSDKHQAPSSSATTANSSTVISAVEDGLAESSSHDSAQTFHSATEDVPASSQQSGIQPIDAHHDKPLPDAPTPLIDHPSLSPTTATGWKFNPSPFNPFTSMIEMSPQARSMTLPRNLLSPGSTPTQTPALPGVGPPAGPSETPIPQSLHPRLASLPPPMMARYATQGSVRLTPSISLRPTPMPILNLPTLPMPTPRIPPPEAVTQSPARLRTMPALPLCGPCEANEADHENAGLDDMDDVDEDEEGDGDGDDDIEMPSEQVSDNESTHEVEVPTAGHRLRSPLPPSLSRSPRLGSLPGVDTSPLNIAWRGSPQAESERPNTQYFTPTEPAPPVDILRTPIAAFRKVPAQPGTDYFTSKQPEQHSPTPDSMSTPRPGDFDFVIPRTVPMPSTSPRPGLLHQGSKSMVDLLSMSRTKEDTEAEVSAAEKRRSRAPDSKPPSDPELPQQPIAGPSTAVSVEEQVKTPALRRQRSLPMYTTATEPPPYPSFTAWHPQPPLVVPREEEGREQLPKYTNQIYLVAIMPRKMEFSAPGFQSKDRKWKRALCVLEGTVFKVYRVHSGVVEDWWERTVGVGDRTTVDPFTVGTAGTIRVSGLLGTERAAQAREHPTKEDGSPSQADIDASEGRASTSGAAMPMCKPPSSRSKLQIAASLLHPSRANHRNGESSLTSRSRLSFDVPRDDVRSSAVTTPRRQSMDSSRSGLASSSRMHRHNSSDTSPTPSSLNPSSSTVSRSASITPATSHFGSTTSCCYLDQEPDPKDLVRAYTLQHAESGLASDYIKRKNVIRVRMEGEQFLLQAKDVPGVIEWIEGIQAATNIALDLDDRPMPKGPIFPRRRRRRNRRTGTESQSTTTGNNATSSSSRPSHAR